MKNLKKFYNLNKNIFNKNNIIILTDKCMNIVKEIYIKKIYTICNKNEIINLLKYSIYMLTRYILHIKPNIIEI